MTPPRASAWQVGLTGGIGSGKSTVATMLVACGAAVVDADQISRRLTAANGAALPAIAQAWLAKDEFPHAGAIQGTIGRDQ